MIRATDNGKRADKGLKSYVKATEVTGRQFRRVRQLVVEDLIYELGSCQLLNCKTYDSTDEQFWLVGRRDVTV